MQEYKPTTIQLRSFARKTLTYHDEKAYANPSCKPSFKRNAKHAKKILPSTSAPHFKRPNTQLGRKNQTSQESELCVMFK
jgi:hypothetical protein